MEFATRAIHVGSPGEDARAGDVTLPIHLTSIYRYESPGEMRAGYEYIRYGNPTRAALEACLGSLEKAPPEAPALCFSSGVAATDCCMRLLHPGDRIAINADVYGGTRNLARAILGPAGVHVDYLGPAGEGLDASLEAGAKMVWFESPSNPLLNIYDIRALADKAHAAGALIAIDNTFSSPYLQTPLDFGVDMVMHSTSKYLGGHSDLLGGAVICGDPAMRAQLYEIQKITGAVASPFDSWLTLRGIRSLPVRMEQHCRNATEVASWLQGHHAVERVYYPGLTDHANHALAARQMRRFGGMVSVLLKGGEAAAVRCLQAVKLFAHAASLGGVESIMSYPPKMSHAALAADERQRLGVSDGLLRLSIGIEDISDIIADLDQALPPA